MNYIDVTEKNITDLLEQYNLIILDFYADWCGPCKSFAPTFYKVSTKYPEICFGKVNSEKELILSEDFEIRSIPTIVVLKDKNIIFQQSGVLFEHSLIALIEQAQKVDVNNLPTDEEI